MFGHKDPVNIKQGESNMRQEQTDEERLRQFWRFGLNVSFAASRHPRTVRGPAWQEFRAPSHYGVESPADAAELSSVSA